MCVCVCARTRGRAHVHVGISAHMCILYGDERTILNPQDSGVIPWVLCMLLYKAVSLTAAELPFGG